MRSAAEAITIVPERRADPLEHIDYRRADTPEEKDSIYRLRYRAYLREGAILPSEAERHRPLRRSSEQLHLWHLRSRRTLQFDPHQRADLGVARVSFV